MNSLLYLRGRRMWFVPDLSIWGVSAATTITFVAVESVQGSVRIEVSQEPLGQATQSVSYADLIDHRGNHLPASITEPKVLIQPKSLDRAYLVGRESGAGFSVARDISASGPVTADIVVIEMG